MNIRVTTLGALQVVRGDAVLSALPSQRLRCALLVYVAVNRQVPRDRLLGLFWADRNEERARHALSQHIYELRRALGDDWVEMRGEQLIAAPHISVDLAAFEESVERGDFVSSLSLYRGPFLDGFFVPGSQAFDNWVDGIRQRAQRHHRRARREFIRYLVDQARWKDALTAARDWTTIDPSDDEAQHRLIELLAETGDRAGAIGQYELYERLLAADELEPLDETRQLIGRIREGAIGALPASSAIHTNVPAPSRPSSAAAQVTAAAETPAPATATPAEPPPAAGAGRATRLSRRHAIVAAVVALFVFLTVVYARNKAADDGIASATPYRVAVLYFDDNSPPPGARHIANGITERLIEAFSGLEPTLAVRSKQVVARFRNADMSLDSLRTLDVDAFIDGNVVSSGGVTRVTVNLVDPATGNVVTTGNVEQAGGDYLELLDNLVDTVQVLLRRKLGSEFDARRLRVEAPSSAAWDGLQLAIAGGVTAARLEREGNSAGAIHELKRADSLLVQLQKLDSRWFEPTIQRALLAEMRANVEAGQHGRERAREWLDTAVSHADRILAKAPSEAAALELRGKLLHRIAAFLPGSQQELRELYRRAEIDLREATRSDPTRAQAHALRASILWSLGRYDAAFDAARDALRQDAFLSQSGSTIYFMALSRFELGQDQQAYDQCREAFQKSRTHEMAYCALNVLAWSNRVPADPAAARDFADLAGPRAHNGNHRTSPRPLLEMLVAATWLRAGNADSARVILDRAARQQSSSGATVWIEAVLRGRLGQIEQAERLLRQFAADSNTLQPALANMRAFQPLRSNPVLLQAIELRDVR